MAIWARAGQCQATRKLTPLGDTIQRPRSGDGVAQIRLGSAGRNDEEVRRTESLFFRGRAPSTSSSIYSIRCAATKSCRESGASEQNMIFSSNMRYFGNIPSRQLRGSMRRSGDRQEINYLGHARGHHRTTPAVSPLGDCQPGHAATTTPQDCHRPVRWCRGWYSSE
jgi:hypothetical protein